MILAVFVVAIALGAETELQIRIILFRPSADRTFVSCHLAPSGIGLPLELGLAVHLLRRDAAAVQSVKV